MKAHRQHLIGGVAVAALVLLIGAGAAPGAESFPLSPGTIWTLTEADLQSTMLLSLGGQQFWRGALCHPRQEFIDGQLVGITYWSEDAEGRILLHGLQAVHPQAYEFYFDPGLVYLDPSLQPGESTTSQAHVFEVVTHGDQWYGLREVEVTCLNREAVVTDLGTFAAMTVNTTWTDSPDAAPWRYGQISAIAYAHGIGPARITRLGGTSPDWQLTGLIGLDLTSAPDAPALTLTAAPNPFNPATEIAFTVPRQGPVRLDIHDVRGRLVRRLLATDLPPGTHRAVWHGRDDHGQRVASGSYQAVLTVGEVRQALAVTLVK
jgi:hypothetical protein